MSGIQSPLLLPPLLATPDGRDGATVLGHSFATAPAIYGLLISVSTGQGLLALPFAAISVMGHVAVWSYLREPPTS